MSALKTGLLSSSIKRLMVPGLIHPRTVDHELANKARWIQDAVHGYKLVRPSKGIDYINDHDRYGRGAALLEKTYAMAKVSSEVTDLDLAKLCLWIGIAYNENLDIESFTFRNDKAIKWYKLGMRHIIREEYKYRANPNTTITDACAVVKASLYNSLGVAYHHHTTRWTGGPIPATAVYNYQKARDIIAVNPHLEKKFKILSAKIEQNSDHRHRTLPSTPPSSTTKGGSDTTNKASTGGNHMVA